MARSRDISKVLSSNSTLATDAEVAATYLTQSNASFAGKNKVINGGFDIWQRGTSFTGFGTVAYTADRWLAVSNTATYTVTRQTSSTSDPVGSKYFARVTATVAGNFDCTFGQPFESTIFDSLKGKTVTLSFYAKASTSLTINVFLNRNTSEGKVYYYEGTIINNTAFSLSTSWNRYSVTLTMPDKSVTNQGLQLSFQTAMTLNQYYDIWGVQLEEGTIATNFVPTGGGSQHDELEICQRYYEKSYDLNTNPGTITDSGQIFWTPGAIASGAITAVFPVEYKVPKRIPDCTITYYSPTTGSSGVVRNRKNNGTSEVDKSTGLGFNSLGENRWHTNFGAGVGATEYFNDDSCSVKFHWTSSAEL